MKYEASNSTRGRGALAAAVLVGLALRIWDLGAESAWLDEAVSLELADASLADLFWGRIRDEGNPWGYYGLLHLWQALVGDGIGGARLLSALAGAATVPAAWLLARASGLGTRACLLSAWAVALAPPLVYLSREARAFALATLLTTLAAWAAARLVERDRARHWAVFGAAAVGLSLLHYYAAFVLVAAGLTLLTARRGAWKGLFASAAAVALVYLPWLSTLQAQFGQGAARSADSWVQHLAFLPAYSLAGRTLVWKDDGLAWLGLVAALAVLGVFAPALLGAWRARRWPRIALGVAMGVVGLAALVSVAGVPMFNTRYLSLVIPCAFVVLAGGAAALPALPRSAVLVVGATLMLASVTRLHLVRHKTDWRAVAETAPSGPVYVADAAATIPLRAARPEGDWRVADASLADAPSARPLALILYDGHPARAADRAALEARLKESRPLKRVHRFGGKPQARLFVFGPEATR